MARYKAIVEYDGTEFHGFQLQVKVRTVQGVLEAALASLGVSQDRVVVLGAGRTDSGVHATGQVIAFDLGWQHPPDALGRALNANLAPDVSVHSVTPAAPTFHPRFDALARRYEYDIDVRAWRSPLRQRYAWQVWPPPDVAAMQQAARLLVGRHDFAGFGAPLESGGATFRDVYQAHWQQHGECLTFTIEANAFLYRMVRRIVGAMHKVGSRHWTVDSLAAVLNRTDTSLNTPVAPAHGLRLVEVRYS